MSQSIDRRDFIKKSLLTPAAGALAMHTTQNQALAGGAAKQSRAAQNFPVSEADLPMGRIKDLKISRILLGGNLLTHFTHSRDLKYVYNLTAHYNTEEKIFETMAMAEAHGVNTLVIHTAPGIMSTLKKYRYKLGGKIQWIICPTAQVDTQPEDYRKQVKQLVDEGVDAIYLWGVVADRLVSEGKVDMIARAVEIAKEQGVPCGVGAHDLKVIRECERNKIDADFYIKTFHHHNYPTGPKADELANAVAEVPGYWCNNPQEVIDFMKGVEKPWFAFKVMAAGAIPPDNAFRYAFENGADFVLAGMFDFEIAEDVLIANRVLKGLRNRTRPWRS
ncbi:twin-arginine translocation signal domain-containing protein [Planctomycetota bacterium]